MLERVAAVNCAKCGAPLATPYQCGYCGNKYVDRDDHETPPDKAVLVMRRQKIAFLTTIGLTSISYAYLVLFFVEFIPTPWLLAATFFNVPLLFGATLGFLVADVHRVLEKQTQDSFGRAILFWCTTERLSWFWLKPLFLVAPLYLWNIAKPLSYALWGWFVGVLLVLAMALKNYWV